MSNQMFMIIALPLNGANEIRFPIRFYDGSQWVDKLKRAKPYSLEQASETRRAILPAQGYKTTYHPIDKVVDVSDLLARFLNIGQRLYTLLPNN